MMAIIMFMPTTAMAMSIAMKSAGVTPLSPRFSSS